MAESYYRALGEDSFESTIHTQGAWNDHEQHMAPVAGLLAYALENCSPRADMRLARISYDILGVIPRGTFDVRASDINEEMKMAAALALAGLISDDELTEDYIIPKAFDPRVGPAVAKAVAEAARKSGVARI